MLAAKIKKAEQTDQLERLSRSVEVEEVTQGGRVGAGTNAHVRGEFCLYLTQGSE